MAIRDCDGMLAASMKPLSVTLLPSSIRPRGSHVLLILALFLAGCASREERELRREEKREEKAMRRANETDDQRAHREVFLDNWLRPSVSEEDKDFYYRSFWKNNSG